MPTDLNQIPPMLSPAQVGKACNISRRSAKSLLAGAGILEQHANGRWYVGETRLRERLPDVFDRVYAYFVMGRP